MPRRQKSFDERRQELTGALQIIARALRHCEESGQIHPLRVVAVQLRALVVRETSGSLRHPLLFELAHERGFPLVVYTIDPGALDTLRSLPAVQFASQGDSLSLVQEPPFSVETNLEQALQDQHTVINGEKLSLKDIIRLVADTEGAHYDTGRPETLDNLDQLRVLGLPPEYRAIYSLGKLVRDLGFRFVESTT